MKYLFIFLFVTILSVSDGQAQCAMCRASVESNMKADSGSGKGLNTGILYLMTIPYLLVGGLAYLWYANSRKESEKQQKIFGTLKKKLSAFGR